jgi:hypothetical protein
VVCLIWLSAIVYGDVGRNQISTDTTEARP